MGTEFRVDATQVGAVLIILLGLHVFARGIAWMPDASVVLQVQSGSGCQIDSRGCATTVRAPASMM